MGVTIEATYENGVFVPTTPPALADHERVRLVVEGLPEATRGAEVIEWRRKHRISADPALAREVA